MDRGETDLEDGRTAACVADRAESLAAARVALIGLVDTLWQASGGELAALLTTLDEVCTLAAAGRVAVVREAVTRGEVSASQAGSLPAWIARHAPSLAVAGGCSHVAAVVDAGGRMTTAPITAAVCEGRVPVPVAVSVIREIDRLRPRLVPEAVPTVVESMLTVGAAYGTRAVRELRVRLLAEHGHPGQFQTEQDSAAGLVALSAAYGDELGAFTYHLTLDAEGKAVLEAAIGPLSAPTPDPDGARDVRPARQRRGQALIEVCRRATAAGDRVPTGAKTTLMVTMPWEQLRDRLGAGRVLGSTADGMLLGPETVRQAACDAQVLPVVLGSAGEILDLGRSQRLFLPGQLKALWLRDRSCTFPGCQTPAHWCDAHHVRHWIDGGTTALDNAALLCGRHHTIVHRDRLTATITGNVVDWDRTPGSYDRARDARLLATSAPDTPVPDTCLTPPGPPDTPPGPPDTPPGPPDTPPDPAPDAPPGSGLGPAGGPASELIRSDGPPRGDGRADRGDVGADHDLHSRWDRSRLDTTGHSLPPPTAASAATPPSAA